ncbi:MAG: class I SAM-dependent methyltransferase [Verrucomicrobiales bacterium]
MKSVPRLPRVTELAHELVRPFLTAGDVAVDATVGNGHDTLFLAECVGKSGRVVGFDIQRDAIEASRTRTVSHPQVELHRAGHETMDRYVDGEIQAAMFNLGYLPSGDKTLTTLPATTVAALTLASHLLATPGILTIVVYPGHEGGKAEAEAVDSWVSSIDSSDFLPVKYELVDPSNRHPWLAAVEKRARR